MNSKVVLGNSFCSIEGEGKHVGRSTLFVHIADGQFKTDTGFVVDLLDPLIHECLVLDSCEGIYMDWEGYALETFDRLKDSGTELILETRGERDLSKFFAMDHVMVYLNHTPGWTMHLNIEAMRPTDQMKFVFYDEEEYIEVLEQAADVQEEAGCPRFLMPRGIEGEERYDIFQKFLETRIKQPRRYYGIRMMLIEHEEVGIL